MGRKKRAEVFAKLGIVDGKESLAANAVAEGKKVKVSRSIEELMQFRGQPFSTLKEHEYLAEIKGMDLAALQDECHKHGLLHNTSKEIMVERLTKVFRQWISAKAISDYKPVQVKEGKVARELAASITRRPIL